MRITTRTKLTQRTASAVQSFEKTTIGEIVAADSRTAAVFEQFGIDFCCGGRRSVAEACRTAAVDPVTVEGALAALASKEADVGDTTRWPLDRVIDHIVGTHHAYVRSALPLIARYLTKLIEVHGARHPELVRVADSFERLGGDLLRHMMKEEWMLFPYVRELALAADDRRRPSPFGTVENPIRMMEREHQEAGDEMRVIRELTAGYTPPSDACTTYRVCFSELARFERDLHQHVHLENNVLFPRAVELEQRHSV
jgi:regulator of cell morphogenesis and NO signaling